MNFQLKTLRKAKDLRQEDIASAVGETKRVIGAWERGETSVPFEKACEIADFLGISLDELAGRWEYVGRVADEQQAAMDEAYRSLDEAQRRMAAASVQGMAMRSRQDAAEKKTASHGRDGAQVAV